MFLAGWAILVLVILIYYWKRPKQKNVYVSPLPKRRLLIVALVPAHNEQECITRTIESLASQSYKLERIVILADNCTDQTIPIVQKLMESTPNLELYCTKDNTAKKSGALNQGLEHISYLNYDLVLAMDADTILDLGLVKHAVEEFRNKPHLGGVCSRYKIIDRPSNLSWCQRIWWSLQSVEYGVEDANRIQNRGKANVLSGTATVLRTDALHQISQHVRPDQRLLVYDEDSIVEDYTLTLDLKSLGWSTEFGLKMFSWTTPPFHFQGSGGFLPQRVRWYEGTLVEILRRGHNPYTHEEFVGQLQLLIMIGARYIFYGYLGYLIFTNATLELNPFSIIVPLVVLADLIYRFKYVDNADWIQKTIVLTILPYELFGLVKELIWIKCYARAIPTLWGDNKNQRGVW